MGGDWEDMDGEDSDEECKQYELEYEQLSRSDVLNILQYAITSQMMSDKKTVCFKGALT